MKVMTSPGLTVRRFVERDGSIPCGSTGYVHLHGDWEPHYRTCVVASAGHIGRFWVAEYDPVRDLYVKLSKGEQFEEGKVVETFS